MCLIARKAVKLKKPRKCFVVKRVSINPQGNIEVTSVFNLWCRWKPGLNTDETSWDAIQHFREHYGKPMEVLVGVFHSIKSAGVAIRTAKKGTFCTNVAVFECEIPQGEEILEGICWRTISQMNGKIGYGSKKLVLKKVL